MSMQRKAPGGHRGRVSLRGLASASASYQGARLPGNWRQRLPDPASYYRARIERLGKANGQGWAQGRCPLHEDRHESLSVHLGNGGWRCFAGCGTGDMVSFHQRLTGRPFANAVRDLLEARA